MSYNTHLFLHKNKEYVILAGKDQTGNDSLLDIASENDIWFHVEGCPSSHIVLQNPEDIAINKIEKKIIKRCACICKASARVSTKCSIIYTTISNVTKTDILGRVETCETRSISI